MPAIVAALASLASPAAQPAAVGRVVLIVVDGLRPDQVTPEVMPRLHALGLRGMVFDAHHSVFPTVTRVNAPSFATGSYPESHGVLGNAIYAPSVFPAKAVNTASHEELLAMDRAEGGLLTSVTLGTTLRGSGRRLAVFSAGSSGSAMLLGYPLVDTIVVNPDLVSPDALRPSVMSAAGPPPKDSVPNVPRNTWIVDAFRALGASTLDADVTAFWFADPDESAHSKGLSDPITRDALTAVDTQIGRVEDTLRERGRLDGTTILVTSDHGFSTHTGELRLPEAVAPFAEPLPDGSPDIVVTEGAINFRRPPTATRVRALVEALQARPEVGAIFTAAERAGSARGAAPGTLAFDVARWQHRRSGAILVSANWTDAANASGVRGTSTLGGVAGHGTSSPYDIHNTLIAAGPGVRGAVHSGVPTANVDIAPTVLALLGLPVPSSMTGRIVRELLTSGPAPPQIAVERRVETVESTNGRYRLTAHLSVAAGSTYLDRAEVTRPPAR
ncbi:MAG: alkaline phosphatase family protein [Vicinamibacterales bacterium]